MWREKRTAAASRAVLREFDRTPEPYRRHRRRTLRHFNIMRELHRRYAGAVILGRFGLESVLESAGAYAPFLEEKARAGAFEIPDAARRERFFACARRIEGEPLTAADPFAAGPL
jgi:hypothetical protein